MMSFVHYRVGGDRPGEIVVYGVLNPNDIGLNVPDPSSGLAMMTGEIVSPALQYAADMGVADRPVMLLSIDKTAIAADGADTATISRMPDGAKLIVNGEIFDPVDGTAVLTSTIPQTFDVRITCWPYQDFALTIEAD